MWSKFTSVLAIVVLMAMIVVGIIESMPVVSMEVEQTIIHKSKDMMRVALVGDFRTETNPDGSTRPVFVVDATGATYSVSDYGPNFKGELKEGDRVYVTVATIKDYMDKKQIESITIDYLITKEDYRNAK